MTDKSADDAVPFEAQSGTAAIHEALGAAAGTAEAREYLRKQGRLTDLQIENLEKQEQFENSHLRWRRFNDQMRGLLQIVAFMVVLAIFGGLCAAVWNASRSDGVVIEAFSVPPDFVQRGLTGDVVAAKVLDRLAAFQAQTNSNRAASSYANNWGDDIKVQIPDTGVSIGEMNRYLHQWLGHETHISGNVYRTATGIAVTARVSGTSSPTFAGSETDLDKLIEHAAETVYRATQPYRYAVYLADHNRQAESRAVYEQLIASGPSLERGWAYIGLSSDLSNNAKFRDAVDTLHRAIAERPDLLLAYINLSNYESSLGHDSQALAAAQQFLARAKDGDASMGTNDFENNLLTAQEDVAGALGDYQQSLVLHRTTLRQPDAHGNWENARVNLMQACGSLHDAACVERSFAALAPSQIPQVLINRSATRQISYLALGDWREALALRPAVTGMLLKMGVIGQFYLREAEDTVVARSAAEMGDFKEAHATIDLAPLDCAQCLRTRGDIRAAERKWASADYWFARAVSFAPTVPFGDTEWGAALLKKGDYDAAIAHFGRANSIAPHFADPLEMWGEALIAKNRSDLALAKFDEADKYAPNWGRLHLKWAEALQWSGDKNSAQKQVAIARALDLSPSEKSELVRLSYRH